MYLNTDRVRLSQVIINFTNNAMKFTPKGSIQMGYRIDEAKDEIYFYVKDTGIGIPEDKINEVFERFVKLNTFGKRYGTRSGYLPGDRRALRRHYRSRF